MRPVGSEQGRIYLPLHIQVRTCVREDLKKMEWHGLFTAHRRHIRRAFERQEKGENVMVVAEFHGELVGQVWVDLRRCAASSAGYVWALRVIPWLQGCGLGTRLLQTAERLIRTLGYAQAELDVNHRNRRARELYERLGYSVVDPDFRVFGRRRPGELRMRKPLTDAGV